MTTVSDPENEAATENQAATTSVRRAVEADTIRMCIPKSLDPLGEAAARAAYAALAAPDGAPVPLEAAGPKSSWWPAGQRLRVRFLGGDAGVQARIRAIAEEWMRYVNIVLDFGNDPHAEIRIAFDTNDGSWSYVGTDNLGIGQGSATMNYGWLTPTTAEWEYRRVVLHEFGHALGLSHEHQSPVAGIPWDKAACYTYYGNTQGWSHAEVDQQVLNKMNAAQTNYTAWDRDSIMEYAVDDQLTIGTFSVDWNQELSGVDRQFVSDRYPRRPRNTGSAHTAVVARESQHLDVFWIAPDGSVRSAWWHEGGQWSAPFVLSPAGSAAPGAITAVARESDHLDVFWVGPDGSVRSAWWHEGKPWSAPFAIAPAGSADPGAVAAVARETGHLDVFWVTQHGQLGSTWWHEGGAWAAPFSLGAEFSVKPGAVAAVARLNNHLDVFWVTQRGELASTWWHEGGAWAAPFTLSAARSVEPGSLSAVARLSSHLDVFWISPDGDVRSVWWHEAGQWSAPFSIGPTRSARCPGHVWVSARMTNHLDLFWVGRDGSVQSAWWHDGQPWSQPFTLVGGNVAEQRSLSAVPRLSNHLDVFYAGPDGSCDSVWWHEGPGWSAAFGIAGGGSVAL